MQEKQQLMQYAIACNAQTGQTLTRQQLDALVNTSYIAALNCCYTARQFIEMYFRHLGNRSMQVAEFQRMSNTRSISR